MSARASVTEPVMAMPMSAAWRAREKLNVFILGILDVMVLPQGGMRRSTRSRRAAANGVVTPFRPEFEVDVREVDDPGRQARIRFADWQHHPTRRETDGKLSPTRP